MAQVTNSRPQSEQLEAELKRVTKKEKFIKVLRSTIYTLVVVAAFAILVAVLFLPVLRIYGSSMTPTLTEGDIVVSVKGSKVETGDIVSVYYGSKVLIKRVIAHERQWVDISDEGDVYVEGVLIDEPYLVEKAYGETNIELPYQVPDSSIFVMGDHRSTSIDSRNTSVGSIATEDIVGKIIFRIWPLDRFGRIEK